MDATTTSLEAGEIPFARVQALCRLSGMDAIAVMSAPQELDGAGFERMLADGIGDMQWLIAQRELRRHPRSLLPGASRLVCTALPYQPTADTSAQHPPGPDGATLRRARYAAGSDYHTLYRTKLARVGDALDQEFPGSFSHRALVDSAPLNERQLALQAGLGWIGRNALVISPRTGSYHFLGYLLSTAPLQLHQGSDGQDRCGRCHACETRCPTAALIDRRVLSERCISYLTIEHQGVIPLELARSFEGWWYGCDLCQEACPWNRFAVVSGDLRLTGDEPSCETLLAVTAEDFDQVFRGRAIRRIGYVRFRRNLLVALFSLGRLDEARRILRESAALALVVEQARELALSPDA